MATPPEFLQQLPLLSIFPVIATSEAQLTRVERNTRLIAAGAAQCFLTINWVFSDLSAQ